MMKRILSVLLCLAMIVGLTTAVSAVSTDVAAAGDDDDVYINIYLDAESGYPVVSAQYHRGEIPTRPDDPGKENEVFIDWYTSPSFGVRFDFSAPLYEDADMYARFAPPEDVIGVNVFASPSSDYPMYGYLLVKGDLISYPPEPEVEEGYAFTGWYSDRELTNPVDFSQPVYDYLYLFPRVVAESDLCYADLYLDADAPEPVYSIVIVKGEPCPVPAEPGREDMTFAGWYTDRSLTTPMDFTQPCTEDFELFAKWEENCSHPHLLDNYTAGYAATATTDGLRESWKCPECGKRFTKFGNRMVEVNNSNDLIIKAKGPYYLGDANGDGKVTAIDSTVIQRQIVMIQYNGGFCRGAADVDNDGKVSVIDATFILRYLARMDVPYMIGVSMFPIN